MLFCIFSKWTLVDCLLVKEKKNNTHSYTHMEAFVSHTYTINCSALHNRLGPSRAVDVI